MRDAQQQAADFAREHGLSLSAQGRFIDLVSEIGELGKEILKATGYETEPFTNHKESGLNGSQVMFSPATSTSRMHRSITCSQCPRISSPARSASFLARASRISLWCLTDSFLIIFLWK